MTFNLNKQQEYIFINIINFKKHTLMKTMKLISMCLAAIFMSTITSCKSNDEENNDGTVYKTRYMLKKPIQFLNITEEQKEMIKNNRTFAFNLMRNVVDQEGVNNSTVISPMGVTYMLGMVNSGANATTQQKIAEVLGFNGSTTKQVNELCHGLLTQLPLIDPNIETETDNALFVNDMKMKDEYADDMKNYYMADVKNVDFSSPDAVTAINEWANKSTHGNIPTVVSSLDPTDGAYVLNNVYFKAEWTKQFDKEMTTTEQFTCEDGTKKNVQMMHCDALVDQTYNDTYRSLCLAYGGAQWYMYILLPREGKTLDDVINSLDSDAMEEMGKHNRDLRTDISIPKFEITQNTGLKDVMSKMGLDFLFDEHESGLSNISNSSPNVFLTNMFQSGNIDVNEEGTEYTAITIAIDKDAATAMPDGKLPEEELRVFNANRSFVYIITDNFYGIPYIVGTYTGK